MPMHKDFRRLWDVAGYGTQMGSAEVVRPPSDNVVRVYHLTTAEYGISNLALKRLKVARFFELNDPFELLSANCKDVSLRRAAQRHKEEFSTKNGLLCFSSNWTDPVLWSHYAGKHSGICLGLNVDRRVAQRVEYEDSRRVFKLDMTSPGGLSVQVRELLVKTKFKHWEYEGEQRVIVELNAASPEGPLYFVPFNANMELAEVVLGPLCHLDLAAVRALVRSRYTDDVKVFRSRPAFGGFSIVPKESTVNW